MSLGGEPRDLERKKEPEPLPGTTVEKKEGGLIFTIVDKDTWNTSAVAKLEPIFGKTIFEEYEGEEFEENNPDHLRRMQEQLQVSFANVDELYVVTNKSGEPTGFMPIQYYHKDRSCAVVRDVVVKQEYRRWVYGVALNLLVYKNPNIRTMFGYTKNPSVAAFGLLAGPRYGLKARFAGEGEAGIEVGIAEAKAKVHLEEEGWEAEGGALPPGLVRLKGELKILPAEEVQVPLFARPSIRRGLEKINEAQKAEIAWNEAQNANLTPEERAKNLPHSIAGIMVAVRESVSEEQ